MNTRPYLNRFFGSRSSSHARMAASKTAVFFGGNSCLLIQTSSLPRSAGSSARLMCFLNRAVCAMRGIISARVRKRQGCSLLC